MALLRVAKSVLYVCVLCLRPAPLYPIPIVRELFERGGTVSWPTRHTLLLI